MPNAAGLMDHCRALSRDVVGKEETVQTIRNEP